MNGPPPTPIPDWLATLVGQLVIENEALRQRVIALTPGNDDQGTVPTVTAPTL